MRRSCLALILALVVMLPARLFAAIAYVQSEASTYANQFASTATWQYTLVNTPVTGRLLVVCFSMLNETRTITSITDNNANALTAASTVTHSAAANITASIRYYVVPATPPTSFTITLSGAATANAGLVVYEFSGHRIAGALDGTPGTAEADDLTSHAVSETTAEANEILLGCTSGTAGTYALDGAFGNDEVSGSSMIAGTRAAATATSYTMTNSSGGNVEDTISILAAFREEPSGSSRPPASLLLRGVGGQR